MNLFYQSVLTLNEAKAKHELQFRICLRNPSESEWCPITGQTNSFGDRWCRNAIRPGRQWPPSKSSLLATFSLWDNGGLHSEYIQSWSVPMTYKKHLHSFRHLYWLLLGFMSQLVDIENCDGSALLTSYFFFVLVYIMIHTREVKLGNLNKIYQKYDENIII